MLPFSLCLIPRRTTEREGESGLGFLKEQMRTKFSVLFYILVQLISGDGPLKHGRTRRGNGNGVQTSSH